MKNFENKNFVVVSVIVIVIVIVILVGLAWLTLSGTDTVTVDTEKEISVEEPELEDSSPTTETMDLTVFLQDREAAIISDCGVTNPKTITVPKTKAVADASLTYLFESELSQYGEYGSVVIKDNVAQVTIINKDDPTGLRISSLSSCESRHLISVLSDTLTAYESIESVELYSPSGKMEF